MPEGELLSSFIKLGIKGLDEVTKKVDALAKRIEKLTTKPLTIQVKLSGLDGALAQAKRLKTELAGLRVGSGGGAGGLEVDAEANAARLARRARSQAASERMRNRERDARGRVLPSGGGGGGAGIIDPNMQKLIEQIKKDAAVAEKAWLKLIVVIRKRIPDAFRAMGKAGRDSLFAFDSAVKRAIAASSRFRQRLPTLAFIKLNKAVRNFNRLPIVKTLSSASKFGTLLGKSLRGGVIATLKATGAAFVALGRSIKSLTPSAAQVKAALGAALGASLRATVASVRSLGQGLSRLATGGFRLVTSSAQKFATMLKTRGVSASKALSRAITGLIRLQRRLRFEMLLAVNILGEQFREFALLTSPALIIGDTVNKVAEFDDQVTKLAGNLKVFKDVQPGLFRAISDEIREIAKETRFLADDVTKAANVFALAGFDAATAIASTRPALELAQAGFLDVETAASISAAAIKQFGLESTTAAQAAASLQRVNNLLVEAQLSGLTTVQQLGDTFARGGPLSQFAGVGIQEFTILAVSLSQVGVAGQEAGTAIRRAFQRLAQQPADVTRVLKELNLDITEFQSRQGVFKEGGVIAFFEALRASGADAGQLTDLFGARAAQLTTIVQNADDLQGIFEKLGAGDAANIAKRLSDQARGTIKGALEIARSEFNDLQIAFGDFLGPALRRFSAGVEEVSIALRKALVDPELLALISEVYNQLKDIASLIAATINPLLKVTFVLVSSLAGVWKGIIDVLSQAAAEILGVRNGVLEVAGVTDTWLNTFKTGLALLTDVTNSAEVYLEVVNGAIQTLGRALSNLGMALYRSFKVVMPLLLTLLQRLGLEFKFVILDAMTGLPGLLGRSARSRLDELRTGIVPLLNTQGEQIGEGTQAELLDQVLERNLLNLAVEVPRAFTDAFSGGRVLEPLTNALFNISGRIENLIAGVAAENVAADDERKATERVRSVVDPVVEGVTAGLGVITEFFGTTLAANTAASIAPVANGLNTFFNGLGAGSVFDRLRVSFNDFGEGFRDNITFFESVGTNFLDGLVNAGFLGGLTLEGLRGGLTSLFGAARDLFAPAPGGAGGAEEEGPGFKAEIFDLQELQRRFQLAGSKSIEEKMADDIELVAGATERAATANEAMLALWPPTSPLV